MTNFKVEDLCRNYIAEQTAILNTPTDSQRENMQALIDNVLNPLCEAYGEDIYIDCGFISEKLNTIIGKSDDSEHLTGCGVTVTTGTRSGNRKLIEVLQKSYIPFDECFEREYYSSVFISFKKRSKNRNRRA